MYTWLHICMYILEVFHVHMITYMYVHTGGISCTHDYIHVCTYCISCTHDYIYVCTY